MSAYSPLHRPSSPLTLHGDKWPSTPPEASYSPIMQLERKCQHGTSDAWRHHMKVTPLVDFSHYYACLFSDDKKGDCFVICWWYCLPYGEARDADPRKYGTFTQCWVNDGPLSATPGQNWPSAGSMCFAYWDVTHCYTIINRINARYMILRDNLTLS